MSPRAAWRLEALGYTGVHDYVAGKADWLAAGLPTEGTGTHPPRAADVMDSSPLTCTTTEPLAVVAARMADRGDDLCVVVNGRGIVQGRLRRDHLGPIGQRTAEDAMEPGPATIRADAGVEETRERMQRRGVTSLIVSNPGGVLLGVLRAPPS